MLPEKKIVFNPLINHRQHRLDKSYNDIELLKNELFVRNSLINRERAFLKNVSIIHADF